MDLNARVDVNCGRMDGWMDGQTDRRTSGLTDGRTENRTPTSHLAKAEVRQKCEKLLQCKSFSHFVDKNIGIFEILTF